MCANNLKIYIHEVKIYFTFYSYKTHNTKTKHTFLPGVLIRKRTPHIYYFTATTYLFQ